jgi:hypothetical protein
MPESSNQDRVCRAVVLRPKRTSDHHYPVNAAGPFRLQRVGSSLQKRRLGTWVKLLLLVGHGDGTGLTQQPVSRCRLCAASDHEQAWSVGLWKRRIESADEALSKTRLARQPASEGVLLRSLYALTQLRCGFTQAVELGMTSAN